MMAWTQEPPKVGGYYWHRTLHRDGKPWGSEEIVFVEDDGHGNLMAYFTFTEVGSPLSELVVDHAIDEWQGPLVPKE